MAIPYLSQLENHVIPILNVPAVLMEFKLDNQRDEAVDFCQDGGFGGGGEVTMERVPNRRWTG